MAKSKTSKKKKDEDLISVLKKKYSKCQKKYSLPKFEDIDKEFKIYRIDQYTTDILFDIRKQISNVLHSLAGIIYPIFTPSEADIVSLIISAGMDKKTKIEAHHLFKKLNYLISRSNSAGLDGEEKSAEFIKEIWKEWPEIKKKIILFSDKIANVWAKEYKSDADVGYLG